ncbi:MAG TPA: HAMP domain-containing sensor histidine kinase [Gaiellaceae bacterium]|nr:HAMP domain-containing sensor histidine kinase [Gaiellaceae bacterium]
MRRLSLRTRLVLGLLVLAAVGLVAADIATYQSQQSFLFQQTDQTLQNEHQFADQAGNRGSDGPGPRTPPGLYVEIRSLQSGAVVYSHLEGFPGQSAGAPPRLPKTIELQAPVGGEPDRVTYFTAPATAGGGRYRVRASIEVENPSQLLIVATPLHDLDASLHRLFLIELFVTLAVLGALVLLALWVVRLGLRPLRAIEQTAGRIAAGDLSQRVEHAEPRTEIGRLGMALNVMLGRIEESDQRLRRFVADASHELRTPLTGVRAYAELFRRGAAGRPDDLERAMTGISRESERMSLLVEDLLLLARLDEGRPFEQERVDLSQVVGEAVETARTVEPTRPIDLAAEPAVVLGDKDRLRQVVDNLLANVRAHTPEGAPVHVRVSRNGANAVLEVEDTGPGLGADEAEQVFERFHRGDPSRSRSSGGVGLGLSIVAAVAEAHGGETSAESTLGKGSTFRVTLPLADRE